MTTACRVADRLRKIATPDPGLLARLQDQCVKVGAAWDIVQRIRCVWRQLVAHSGRQVRIGAALSSVAHNGDAGRLVKKCQRRLGEAQHPAHRIAWTQFFGFLVCARSPRIRASSITSSSGRLIASSAPHRSADRRAAASLRVTIIKYSWCVCVAHATRGQSASGRLVPAKSGRATPDDVPCAVQPVGTTL